METWQENRLRSHPGGDRCYDVSKWVVDVAWGTFLGPRQVRALGGLAALERDAPVYEVQRISMADRPDDEPGAFLQLTERLQECGQEQIGQLREYFEPVLPRSPGPNDRNGRMLALRRAADSMKKRAAAWEDRPRYKSQAQKTIASLEDEIQALQQGGEPNRNQEFCRRPFLDAE